MVGVLQVARPVATVLFWVDPEPEQTREIAPIANTRQVVGSSVEINQVRIEILIWLWYKVIV